MLLPAPFSTSSSGIYAIVNRDSGKIYIGSAVKLSPRWNEHRCDLRNKEHHSRYLQRAFNKCPGSFYLEVVEEIPNSEKQKLLTREQFWMDFFRSYDPTFGYNISPTAQSCQGIKRSPELKAKISASLKGRKMSPERLKQHTLAVKGHKGRGWTEGQILEQRNRALGKKRSPESIAKFSKWIRENPTMREPVSQYTKDGKLVASLRTIKEAEVSMGGKRSNISGVCKFKRKTSNGFVWRYTVGIPEVQISPLSKVVQAGRRCLRTLEKRA